MFGIRRAKLEEKRGLYCLSDGTQRLLPCSFNSGLLCDLGYVSSEQIYNCIFYCSEPSAIDLSVLQADRPRLSCCNDDGRLPN